MSFKQLAALCVLASSLVISGCQTSPDEQGLGGSSEVSDTGTESDSQNDSSSYGVDEDSVSGGEVESGVDAVTQQLLSAKTFYFDFDSSKVRRDSADALMAHATVLANNPAASVRLEGHADERGTREYNIALGERRGDSVARFLQANGASSSQIEVVSYGEEKPANYSSSERAWAENRRVELVYVSGRP